MKRMKDCRRFNGINTCMCTFLASCGGTDNTVTPDEKTVSSISITKKPTKTTL